MAEGPREGTTGAEAATVFISYASQDATVAMAVVAALEANGIRCWIAPRDVVAGDFYADAIVRAIDAARVTVLVLSEHSADSHHVLREIERASAKRHPVISLRIDRAPMPPAFEYFLNTSQWLDATAEDIGHATPKLIEAIRRPLGSGVRSTVGESTPPPAHAAGVAPRPRGARRWRLAAVTGLLLALGFAGYWALDRPGARRGAATGHATLATAAPAGVPASSVAVLPFVDMSERKDQEYFADGLTEELIDLLVKGTELRVPARTSSFYFKGRQASLAEIATTLGVANLLEGSVRMAGKTMRVTVQLIRVSDGYHLWSNSYDRQMKDVFAVQDEIAAATVAALKSTLSPPASAPAVRRTANPEAYTQYLIGRKLVASFNHASYVGAVEAFQKAVDLDPSFAAAYVGLSDATYLRDGNSYTVPPANYARAQAMLAHAIELAPDLADGYSERGIDRLDHDGDLDGADADLSRAIALDPRSSINQRRYGYLLRCQGHVPAAIRFGRQATETDPLDPFAWMHLGQALRAGGQYAAARAAFLKVGELAPDAAGFKVELLEVLLLEGRAAEVMRQVVALPDESDRLYFRALAEFTLGHERESQQALDALARWVSSREVAYGDVADVHAWRGEKRESIAWLEKAAVRERGAVACLRTDPLYKAMRDDPEFKAFLIRAKL